MRVEYSSTLTPQRIDAAMALVDKDDVEVLGRNRRSWLTGGNNDDVVTVKVGPFADGVRARPEDRSHYAGSSDHHLAGCADGVRSGAG